MSEMYDLIILGAGPAGISAAIYAARAKLNTLWLEKKFVAGGQITNTYEVDNYPGMPGMNGMDLGRLWQPMQSGWEFLPCVKMLFLWKMKEK